MASKAQLSKSIYKTFEQSRSATQYIKNQRSLLKEKSDPPESQRVFSELKELGKKPT